MRLKHAVLMVAVLLALGLGATASANRPDNEVRYMHVTGYRACDLSIALAKPCNGITASGKPVQWGLAACGREHAFGTVFEVPGLGVFACYDRGGGVHNNLLDIYMPDGMGIGGSRWQNVTIRYDLDGEQVLSDALAASGGGVGLSVSAKAAPGKPLAENLLGYALTDSLRRFYNADVALLHNGALQGKMGLNELTAANVTSVLPKNQRGMTVHVRGEVLKQMIEYSLAQDVRTDLQLILSGLNLVYNPSAPIGKRVVHLTRADTREPIWENAYYYVALTDGLFLADGYTELLETGRGHLTFEPAADTVAKWITSQGVPAPSEGRMSPLQ